MELRKKRQYIFDNITKIEDHKNYIDFIKLNNCPHTSNINGLFINLNKLEDNVISDLYDRLNNELTNNSIINNREEVDTIKNVIYVLDNNDKSESKRIDLNIDEFEIYHQDIIQYSKKYNL